MKRMAQYRSAATKKKRTDVMNIIVNKKVEIPALSGMTSKTGVIQSVTETEGVPENCRDQAIQVCPETKNKLRVTVKIKRRAVQTTSQAKDKNTSPSKNNIRSIATSPFKPKSAKLANRKFIFSSGKLGVSSFSSPSKSSLSESPQRYGCVYTATPSSLRPPFTNISTSSYQATKLPYMKRKIEAKRLHQISTENTKSSPSESPQLYGCVYTATPSSLRPSFTNNISTSSYQASKLSYIKRKIEAKRLHQISTENTLSTIN